MIKKFIIKLLIFLVLLCAVNFAFNRYFKQYVIKNQDIFRKDIQFDNYNDTLKYLLMGDSHIQNGINPLIFRKSFNFSSANENYIQTYYKLKAIIEKKNRIPEYIFLPVDLSSFSSFRTDRFKYDTYWVQYIDYFELAKIKKDRIYIDKWFIGNYISYIEGYEYAYRFLLGEKSELILGYKPRKRDRSIFVDRIRNARARVNLYFKDYTYFDQDLVLFFKRILGLCSQNNIKVILIKMPVSKIYYNLAVSIVDKDSLNNNINKIICKYPGLVRTLDYQKLFFDNPEYFDNPDHLNDKGATDLSRILNDRLNK